MGPWSIGVEKALGTIAQGVESSNGSLVQIGVDRLRARAEMSQELAACMPNSCAEAVQEGVAKLWRRVLEAPKKGRPGDRMDWSPLAEDMPWIFGIVSTQDEWSKLCVEESVRLMANSAARCEPLVSAMRSMDLAGCLHAASSCFTALCTLDRLSRLGEVDEGAQKAVGAMLLAYRMDASSAGAWEKCAGLSLVGAPGGDPRLSWTASAGIHPATIASALAAAGAGRRGPRG